MPGHLPDEVRVLLSHVVLSEAGWQQKALGRLLIGALWIAATPRSTESLSLDLRRDFGVAVGTESIRAVLESLVETRHVCQMQDGAWRVTEEYRSAFEEEIEKAEALECRVKSRFQASLNASGSDLDPDRVWEEFRDELLVPMVRSLGAQTYSLVIGRKYETQGAWLQDFLAKYDAVYHGSIQRAVAEAWDPTNADAREYILRFLNSYFLATAVDLPASTLQDLNKLAQHKPEFTVFVDTNFLFSILKLHENPSDEAAVRLVEVISQVTDSVTVNLSVLPITVREMRATLTSVGESLSGVVVTPNIAEGAVNASSGILGRIMTEVERTGVQLTADEFLSPYTSNLLQMIRDAGIGFHNADLQTYSTAQDVVDDILQQKEHQKKTGTRNPKRYAALEHDVVLWHYAKHRREAIVETPAEAKYWVLTLDYRFLGFDQYKMRSHAYTLPICLHPISFMQLLQLWVPRTPAFDEAILGAMRLPFLFQEFDADAEAVTITILRQLSRFEDVGDVAPATVTKVLMNKALRHRMQENSDPEQQAAAVRDALIAEHEAARELLEQEVASHKERQRELDSQLDAEKKKATTTEHRLEIAQCELADLRGRVAQLEKSIEKDEQRRNQAEEIKWMRRRFTMRWSGIALLAVCLGYPTGQWLSSSVLPQLWPWAGGVAISGSVLALAVFIGIRRGQDVEAIRDWGVFRYVRRGWKATATIFVIGLLPVITNLLTDPIKSLFSGIVKR